ncbi:hypothetical protein BDV97DRAFT_172806 [Delphinella strobiligena]|nr:hypothetical protein BDV97DRAFT_172806 [Delphinella strobiligena]
MLRDSDIFIRSLLLSISQATSKRLSIPFISPCSSTLSYTWTFSLGVPQLLFSTNTSRDSGLAVVDRHSRAPTNLDMVHGQSPDPTLTGRSRSKTAACPKSDLLDEGRQRTYTLVTDTTCLPMRMPFQLSVYFQALSPLNLSIFLGERSG